MRNSTHDVILQDSTGIQLIMSIQNNMYDFNAFQRHFPFIDRMESRYNRVPMTNSRTMRDKLREQVLEKLKEESALGPMNAFNSCKLSD